LIYALKKIFKIKIYFIKKLMDNSKL